MKEEKEAFIESLYLQYAGKLERASLNYVRHRGEYRDLVDDRAGGEAEHDHRRDSDGAGAAEKEGAAAGRGRADMTDGIRDIGYRMEGTA